MGTADYLYLGVQIRLCQWPRLHFLYLERATSIGDQEQFYVSRFLPLHSLVSAAFAGRLDLAFSESQVLVEYL